MIKLDIKGWSEASAWLDRDSWSRLDFCQRLYPCTCLRGIALNSVADSLYSRQPCEFELVDREHAGALIYALESCGAQFEIKYPRPGKVILLDHYRNRVGVGKTDTDAVADAR